MRVFDILRAQMSRKPDLNPDLKPDPKHDPQPGH